MSLYMAVIAYCLLEKKTFFRPFAPLLQLSGLAAMKIQSEIQRFLWGKPSLMFHLTVRKAAKTTHLIPKTSRLC